MASEPKIQFAKNVVNNGEKNISIRLNQIVL